MRKSKLRDRNHRIGEKKQTNNEKTNEAAYLRITNYS